MNVMEPFFIAESNSFVGDSGYNMTMGGEGSIGAVRSDEFKMKLSKLHTGRTWSKESVEKSAASKRGIPRSDETKEKLSAANIGKKWSDETKAKWIASRKGKPWSAETRAKRLTNKMNGISHVEGL